MLMALDKQGERRVVFFFDESLVSSLLSANTLDTMSQLFAECRSPGTALTLHGSRSVSGHCMLSLGAVVVPNGARFRVLMPPWQAIDEYKATGGRN
jgi:hypothetical protein